MSKYFEFVPVSENPEKDGEYFLASAALYEKKDGWSVSGTRTHYLRPLLPTKTDEKEAEKYADEVVGKPTCTRDKLEWNDVRNSFLAGILHERASGKGWVKISDGLPLDRQKILFVLDNGETRMGSFIKKDQWDRVNMFCDGSFFTSGSVAYWMTVPEKPKENVDKASQ